LVARYDGVSSRSLGILTPYFFRSAFASGFVSSGFVSSGFVSSGFVSSGFVSSSEVRDLKRPNSN